jgi:hypothetical protein
MVPLFDAICALCDPSASQIEQYIGSIVYVPERLKPWEQLWEDGEEGMSERCHSPKPQSRPVLSPSQIRRRDDHNEHVRERSGHWKYQN